MYIMNALSMRRLHFVEATLYTIYAIKWVLRSKMISNLKPVSFRIHIIWGLTVSPCPINVYVVIGRNILRCSFPYAKLQRQCLFAENMAFNF